MLNREGAKDAKGRGEKEEFLLSLLPFAPSRFKKESV